MGPTGPISLDKGLFGPFPYSYIGPGPIWPIGPWAFGPVALRPIGPVGQYTYFSIALNKGAWPWSMGPMGPMAQWAIPLLRATLFIGPGP